MRRSLAVTMVIVLFLVAVALFLWAIVPVITDQVAQITDNAPGWLDQLQRNRQVQDLDERFDVIDKVRDYVQDGNFASGSSAAYSASGCACSARWPTRFLIIVMTLYFLSSLEATKNALYRLAPASRRERVSKLGDRVVESVGGYVAGAFVIALCAGISSLIFLFIVGLGEYAVALAFVVMLLDVIPMIGATIGAVIVSAIAFATDWKIGVACVIFYVIYQQVENYVLYPRVMSKSVDIPGAVTVIAALVGAALLGVVGALLAIPTAAAILLIVREVFIRRQDARSGPLARWSVSDPCGVVAAGCESDERGPLPQLDGHHAGQDQHAAQQLHRPRQLVEQDPGPQHAEDQLGSATNDASREPSRRMAAMPVT